VAESVLIFEIFLYFDKIFTVRNAGFADVPALKMASDCSGFG
jgi:hypothetical protein